MSYLESIKWGVPHNDILATGDELYFRLPNRPCLEWHGVTTEEAQRYRCLPGTRPAAVYLERSRKNEACSLGVARYIAKPSGRKTVVTTAPVVPDVNLRWSALQLHKSDQELDSIREEMRDYTALHVGGVVTERFLYYAVDEPFVGVGLMLPPDITEQREAAFLPNLEQEATIIPFPLRARPQGQ